VATAAEDRLSFRRNSHTSLRFMSSLAPTDLHHERRAMGGGIKPDRRRALELLAASRDGATEAIMIAHAEQLVELIDAALATTSVDRNRSR